MVGAAHTSAQTAKRQRLAFVHSGLSIDQLTEAAGPFWVRRFFQTLRRLDHVEGANLVVERYSAVGHFDRFAALAAEVVGRNPDVIVANGVLPNVFKAATSTIPIVGVTAIQNWEGLVASIARPGGNLTGVSIDAGMEVYGKLVQILKETMPTAVKVGFVSSRTLVSEKLSATLSETGQRLGIMLSDEYLAPVNEEKLRIAFASMDSRKVSAAIVSGDGSFLANRDLIVELAAKYRIPTLYPYRDYVEVGGLISYGSELGELAQRLAFDVHQIFTGTKPGDIPIYQPTKFELVINLRTARTLGLVLPASILTQADEVIE
jgi:putative ABC transport system substrate-binding protein